MIEYFFLQPHNHAKLNSHSHQYMAMFVSAASIFSSTVQLTHVALLNDFIRHTANKLH